MIRAEQPAADPGSPAEEVVERRFQGADGLVGDPASCSVDFALAAVEGFVEVGEGFRQRLARRPDGLGLLGLDGPELLDRLPQCRDRGLGLLDQAPPALGLQLQLVPQRRELLDQIDDPEIPRRRLRLRVEPGLESVSGSSASMRASSSHRRNRSRMASTSASVVHGESARTAGCRPEAGRRAAWRARSAAIASNESFLVSIMKSCSLQPVGRVAQRLVGRVDGREPLGCPVGRKRADQLEIALADLGLAGIRCQPQDS